MKQSKQYELVTEHDHMSQYAGKHGITAYQDSESKWFCEGVFGCSSSYDSPENAIRETCRRHGMKIISLTDVTDVSEDTDEPDMTIDDSEIERLYPIALDILAKNPIVKNIIESCGDLEDWTQDDESVTFIYQYDECDFYAVMCRGDLVESDGDEDIRPDDDNFNICLYHPDMDDSIDASEGDWQDVLMHLQYWFPAEIARYQETSDTVAKCVGEICNGETSIGQALRDNFPNATSGDESPEMATMLVNCIETYVREWIKWNDDTARVLPIPEHQFER